MSEDVPDVEVEVPGVLPGVLPTQPAGEGELAVVGPDMFRLSPSRHLLAAVLTGPTELGLISGGVRPHLRLLTALRL